MLFSEQRNDKTQLELGLIFAKGPADMRDYNKAANWFIRSARQGNADAQYIIGLMYSRGIGVSLDYIKAYAWLKIAAEQGSRKSIQYLKKIVAKIPRNRLKKARNFSHQYVRKYVK